jgi:hypothetical protein
MSGVKGMLAKSSKDAVGLLRRMHKEVQSAAEELTMHEEVCFWNDSVLLVGCVDGSAERHEKIMREVCIIKNAVDKVKRAYAICVKGQPFPPPHGESEFTSGRPRLIYLHASSLAFSNCFMIEEEAKKRKWRRDWYIDNRIIKEIDARLPDRKHVLHLWPRKRKCTLYMYSGTFWASKGNDGIAQQDKSSGRGKPRR